MALPPVSNHNLQGLFAAEDDPEEPRDNAAESASDDQAQRAAPLARDPPPIVNPSLLALLPQRQTTAAPVSANGSNASSQPKTATSSTGSGATPAAASATRPDGNARGATTPANRSAPDTQMPGIGTALMQGLWASGRDFANTGSAISGGRPDADDQNSAAAAPLQWSDLLSPGSTLAPKLAYQFAHSMPATAAGVAGATLGTAAVGGPEDPLAIVTGPLGGALGAGMVSGLQSFGNYFGEELHKSPGDADGAYNRALQRAATSGAFSGAAWAAFSVGGALFKGPLKNLMFQAFGVQPAISMSHQAADNALTGKPLTEGLGSAYTQGAIGTAAIAGGHHVAKLAGQYNLQVNPNTLGSNFGNIRIVKRPLVVPDGKISSDGKSGFKLNKKAVPDAKRIDGQPEARNSEAEASREAAAASAIAGYGDVTKVYMGKSADARLYGTAESGRKSPDVIGETEDGKFRLGEAKGTDTDGAVQQFRAAGRILDPNRMDAESDDANAPDPVRDKIKSQDLYCNRLGSGYKADSQGFLMSVDPETGAYHLVRPNGKPVRVHIVE